jgi:hypothetical protein
MEETMCCFATILVLFGPRLAIILWWLFDMARWERAFDTIMWPILGFIFLPWTLIVYVLVFPGGVIGIDWLWMVLGVLMDIFSYTGGYRNRRWRR